MEILIEIILNVYLKMMMLVVPERNVTKKQKRIAEVAASVVTIGMVALAVWGIVLIVDHGNLWGIAPIAVAVVLSLAQILAGALLYWKNNE